MDGPGPAPYCWIGRVASPVQPENPHAYQPTLVPICGARIGVRAWRPESTQMVDLAHPHAESPVVVGSPTPNEVLPAAESLGKAEGALLDRIAASFRGAAAARLPCRVLANPVRRVAPGRFRRTREPAIIGEIVEAITEEVTSCIPVHCP